MTQMGKGDDREQCRGIGGRDGIGMQARGYGEPERDFGSKSRAGSRTCVEDMWRL
jgi:hypothetical protein